jgi:lipid-A-disaccharide synthase
MARWLDLMLCIFPFEADLYNESGLRTIFVGHPMIERLRERQPSQGYGSAGKIDIERDPNVIGLFPGSRAREVRKIFPILIETARELVRQKPNLRFEISAASDELARMISEALDPHLNPIPGQGEADAERRVRVVRDAGSLMQRAFVGIVASGSATLEAAYFRMPFALIYKVAWPTYFAGRLLVKVKYLGMPNVLADREIIPEFIQHRARPKDLAKAVAQLLDDSTARERMVSEFKNISAQLGESGASGRAAKAIIAEIA